VTIHIRHRSRPRRSLTSPASAPATPGSGGPGRCRAAGWVVRRIRQVAADERPDHGSVTVELVLLAPVLLLLLGAVVLAGRVALAGGAVEQGAAAGARAASLARDPAAATAAARGAVQAALAQQGLQCAAVTVTVDTTGFGMPLGRPATVAVRVECQLRLADLSLPGVPGTRTLAAVTTSPLDPYRARTTSATSTGSGFGGPG
jgi:Flp pilus assembly protein TadG